MVFSQTSQPKTDRERDGLMGPVRRVKTELAKVSNKTGKAIEAPRLVLETVAYDVNGTKTENAYYPISSATLTGKEVYKYDDKGNISEMVLLNTDGTLLSKEVYTYEFDSNGNWTKMTTAIAVVVDGHLSFEPTEITYRSISYYLDAATLAKMSEPQPAASPAQVSSALINRTSFSEVKQPAPIAVNNGQNIAQNTVSVPPPVKSGAASFNPAFAAGNNVQSSTTGPKPQGEPPAMAAHPSILPKPLLRPVSGGVLNGSAISLPKPMYPNAARNFRASGVVVVEVVINTDGRVVSARATSGPVILQAAAVEAAYRARFSLTTVSGQPVKVSGTINYTFTYVN